MTGTDLLEALSARGRVVSLLPVVAAGLFITAILAAGAPGAEPSLHRAWQVLRGLSASQVLLLTVALVIVALLLDPLQLRLVRLLEGYWPPRLAIVARRSHKRQRNRRDRAAQAATIGDDLSPQAVQEAGAQAARLQQRFPDDLDAIRPTALGNVLTAMETRAGQQYGWDAVVTWPRLYPLLSPDVRAVVDGQRDRLDALARLAMTSAATALLTVVLLSGSGWWVLVAAIPAVVARLAYIGAVHSAMSYGEAVTVAFDLHRFDLLTQLHLPLPADIGQERKIASQVSLMWRQGVPPALSYDHGPAPEAGREPPGGDALHTTKPAAGTAAVARTEMRTGQPEGIQPRPPALDTGTANRDTSALTRGLRTHVR